MAESYLNFLDLQHTNNYNQLNPETISQSYYCYQEDQRGYQHYTNENVVYEKNYNGPVQTSTPSSEIVPNFVNYQVYQDSTNGNLGGHCNTIQPIQHSQTHQYVSENHLCGSTVTTNEPVPQQIWASTYWPPAQTQSDHFWSRSDQTQLASTSYTSPPVVANTQLMMPSINNRKYPTCKCDGCANPTVPLPVNYPVSQQFTPGPAIIIPKARSMQRLITRRDAPYKLGSNRSPRYTKKKIASYSEMSSSPLDLTMHQKNIDDTFHTLCKTAKPAKGTDVKAIEYNGEDEERQLVIDETRGEDEPSVVNVKAAHNETETAVTRQLKTCAKCKEHGLKIPVRGHLCPRKSCLCYKCKLIEERREILRMQTQGSRRYEKERKMEMTEQVQRPQVQYPQIIPMSYVANGYSMSFLPIRSKSVDEKVITSQVQQQRN